MNRYYVFAITAVLVLIGSFWGYRVFHEHSRSAPVAHAAPKQVVHKQVAVQPKLGKARLAIVLDDWGYTGSMLPLLFKIKSPITIAVLPKHKFSRTIAQEAKARGYQVILHLPLESKSNKAAEKDTLYTSMGAEEMRLKTKALLLSVPGIVGVNNHQGSKATEDPVMMKTVLSVINEQGLFFLDSRTTGKPVSLAVARNVGIRFAESDGFIDLPPADLPDEAYRAYVKKNLDALGALALKRGHAVGIGHDLKITLDVLRTEIPELEKIGITFVFLSDEVY